MKNILYINSCVRKDSRTNRLAKAVLDKLEGDVTEIRLWEEDLKPLDEKRLEERDALLQAGDLDNEMFDHARQFRDADIIVMAAPYWDLQFPALVKIYIENITATGITFEYTPQGYPHGLCKAEKLIYVTTSGGGIGPYGFGFEYVKIMAEGMYGIKEVKEYRAENLDVIGNDPEAILQEAIASIE